MKVALWTLNVVSLCLFMYVAAGEEVKPPPLPPAIEFLPADVVSVDQLNADEVQFIRTAFHASKINEVLNVLIQIDRDKNSGVLMALRHPKDSPLAAFVYFSMFKDPDDFELQLFNAVYKEADARNKVRVPDLDGEVKFLRDKLEKKVADSKYFSDLLSALKKAAK